jgi:hypothetical protein
MARSRPARKVGLSLRALVASRKPNGEAWIERKSRLHCGPRFVQLPEARRNSQGGVSPKYHCFGEFSFDERNLGDLGLGI